MLIHIPKWAGMIWFFNGYWKTFITVLKSHTGYYIAASEHDKQREGIHQADKKQNSAASK